MAHQDRSDRLLNYTPRYRPHGGRSSRNTVGCGLCCITLIANLASPETVKGIQTPDPSHYPIRVLRNLRAKGQASTNTTILVSGHRHKGSLPAHSRMLQQPSIITVESLSDRAIDDAVHAARSPPYASRHEIQPWLTSGSGQSNKQTAVGREMRIGLYYVPIDSCDLSRPPCEDHEEDV